MEALADWQKLSYVCSTCSGELILTFLEWNDCRREAESTSEGTGSPAQRRSQEEADRAEGGAADSEVGVHVEEAVV